MSSWVFGGKLEVDCAEKVLGTEGIEGGPAASVIGGKDGGVVGRNSDWDLEGSSNTEIADGTFGSSTCEYRGEVGFEF